MLTTKQFKWIQVLSGNLAALFDNVADVFVAGDLLWYPVEGYPEIRNAPAVLVAFGRPKGHRASYKQWEESDVAPQVVFEILSPSNDYDEMIAKQLFYEEHGVQEYYVYDPDTQSLTVHLRQSGLLHPTKTGRTSSARC
jgi:Uma2 family endonuclease